MADHPPHSSLRDALSQGHLDVVDELKGVAIALVVAFHFESLVAGTNRLQGQVGVDLFLLLSGWGLGRSVTPATRAGPFVVRRIWKVLPAYWLAVGLFGVVKPLLLGRPLDARNLLVHLAGLQAFAPPAYFFGFNPSFWFISILLLTYPLAFLLRRRHQPWLIAAVTVGLALAATGVFRRLGMTVQDAQIPARLVTFGVGLAGAAALHREVDWRMHRRAGLLALLAAAYLEARGVHLLLPAVFAVAIVAAYGVLRGGLAAPRRWPWPAAALAALGAISYEWYLLHQPLLRLGLHALALADAREGRLISAGLGAVVSVAAAWGLHAALAARMGRPPAALRAPG